MSSTRAKHWAWSQLDLTRSELLLLLAMADNVGEDLRCYARVQRLAAMARMSERQAQRLLDKLVADGRAERMIRPGLTTLYTLRIPPDFGAETGDRPRRRKGPSTPDTMSGVSGSAAPGATPDKVSGVTPDTMSGVAPPTPRRDTPTPRRGTDDTMSPNSSLDSSLPKPSSRTHAPDTPGALTREQDAKLGQLRHRAATVGTTAPSKSEIDDLIAGGRVAERRIEEAETRDVHARAERMRLERAAPKPPDEEAA